MVTVIVVGFLVFVLLFTWCLCIIATRSDKRESEMFQLQRYCARCPHKEAERKSKAIALLKTSPYMSDEMKRPSVKGGTA